MNKDKVIEMAREAGLHVYPDSLVRTPTSQQLLAFAAAIQDQALEKAARHILVERGDDEFLLRSTLAEEIRALKGK